MSVTSGDNFGTLSALYDHAVSTGEQPFKNYRRSTRIPLDVSIEVEGEIGALKGVTVIVNLHGALIRVIKPVVVGSRIRLTVKLTGLSAFARVVYASEENPLTCGVELEKPQNLWGISLAPDDWKAASGTEIRP